MYQLKLKLVYLKYDIKYFLKNLTYYRKLRLHKAKKTGVLYFVFEPNASHPGLADRMKAIIKLYNSAKKNGLNFKVYFKTPFDINDYWQLHKKNTLNLNELEYSAYDTLIINECNWHNIPVMSKKKQYHCYNYAGNDMPYKFSDTGYKWHELFKELFVPSEQLLDAYKQLGIKDNNYISVQLRFVNALEDFESVSCCNNALNGEDAKCRLIKKCKYGIQKIIDFNMGKTVYVFSDSERFLNSLHDMAVKIINYGKPGHTGNTDRENVLMRTFLDLQVMSNSKAIYRIRAKELYNGSCFALLASRMNNVRFIDVNLE